MIERELLIQEQIDRILTIEQPIVELSNSQIWLEALRTIFEPIGPEHPIVLPPLPPPYMPYYDLYYGWSVPSLPFSQLNLYRIMG